MTDMPRERVEVEPDGPEQPAPPAGRRFRPVMVAVGYLLILGILTLWSVGTPKYGAPDELAHARRAASLVRGQLLGSHADGLTPAYVRVRVPATIGKSPNPCFAFNSGINASCAAPWRQLSGTVEVVTYVGRYPPLYYLVSGVPSLLTTGPDVLLWMRAAGAALCAVFLLGAVLCAARVGRAAALGVAIATSPMVLFIGGVLNASGLEIAAAACLWAAGAELVLTPAGRPVRRGAVVWAGLSAAVLVQVRGISPVVLLVAMVCLALLAGRRRLGELARRRDVRIAAAVTAAFTVLAVVWIKAADTLQLLPVGTPVHPSDSNLAVLHRSLLKAGINWQEMIGVLGWLDTRLPVRDYRLWETATLGLLIALLVARSLRGTLAVALAAVTAIALPTLVTYSQARNLGIIGAGRYTLPFAVGVPILAGFVITARNRDGGRRLLAGRVSAAAARRIAGGFVLVVALVLAAVQVDAYLRGLHRYTTGLGHPLRLVGAPWEPPVPAAVALGLYAGFQVAWVAWWWWVSRPTPLAAAEVAAEPAPARVASAT